ncbi:hypothetical protein OG936_21670 [Streptomyces sp. NBC_00846]|uniref:hypothetical protein n=1 Tax=Streptomyces sp. NBC_00846 TaxID=2975849 RepID=UPI00386C139F|nr:hypothetical protein OG936_21670 [Streptomyces sp. NBC_00846]
MDDGYRNAVVDQLYVQEERLAAPALGFDAARVLAHALRARRAELGWAAGTVALWILAVVLTHGLFAILLGASIYLALASWARGTAARPPFFRQAGGFILRWYGRILLTVGLAGLVYSAFSGGETGDPSDSSAFAFEPSQDSWTASVIPLSQPFAGGAGSGAAWGAMVLFALLTVLVAVQRGQFARVMNGELARKNFSDVAADPAERAEGVRFRRLQYRIRAEQHAPLIMYSTGNPFCGAGLPYSPWNLAVELRPSKDRPTEPIDNAQVLRRVVPLLEALRVPSPHGSKEAAAAVRDRLRELQIDECVFLPVAGMPRREDTPYSPEGFDRHRLGSVEEGGESRRHFLRIRVGGWNEQVVVTVFVRVHTQGGMLMLEVAPHVLMPVRALFQEADRIAHRHRNNNWLGKAVWALTRTPGSFGRAIGTLARGAVSGWTILTAGNGGALPDGPQASVRELGSDQEASLFQDMDVNRYLKSIQDRVANGVRLALHEAGWQTDEFEQKIVNVGAGGVFIESAHDSAIGIGDRNTVTNTHRNAESGPTPGAKANWTPNTGGK